MNIDHNLTEDSFFESPQDAQKAAKQQSLIGPYQHLQICYYTGSKIITADENLIHLPSDFAAHLLELGTRPPTKIVKKNGSVVLLPKPYVQNLKPKTRATSGDICQFSQCIIDKLNEYEQLKEIHYQQLLIKVRSNPLDFNEKLRIYIGADYGGKVVLNNYRIIRDAAKAMGYEVLYDENSDVELMDDYRRVKTIAQFNPHITFNINRVRNHFLNEATFNVIWFQDHTLVLVDDSKIRLRERDNVYYLTQEINDCLIAKGVKANRQDFFLNSDVFKERSDVARSNKKIVFVGSSYKSRLEKYSRTNNLKILTNELLELFKQDWNVTESKLNQLLSSIELNEADFLAVPDFHVNELLDYFNRDLLLEEIVKHIDGYELEIYGDGWRDNQLLSPYHKGSVKYGEEISKKYNEAQFSLVPAGGYILQLRVIEAISSGCIPLAFDNRSSARIKPPYYQEAICYFNSPRQLKQQLKKTCYSDKDLTNIKADTHASAFLKKIEQKIRSTLQISKENTGQNQAMCARSRISR
ncbi:hypothetical protein DXX93_05340 [Thalassotalea euphylliae]|uniref:Spore protein YkvP/CgeB glycosyl transferase-like domain-containing protein n=1 Tax=Thalassotalea euphylliae TaxID=1655234 RepID=A0A3E0TN82_9GAMM|nr:hypothetical protein [Thalassotalea euphylliae]REL26051.1 hypothetical protein DXX93_05340 [Thalassotalea euphylliae]